jgi:ubiquinone/menaquinone biosynthesis C-methylase UbiE/uncharacterized protein YbaR (Trm112 family)
MISPHVFDCLRCPACSDDALHLGSGRRPDIVCDACGHAYPIIDGIADMKSPDSAPDPGEYRTETLFNLIAGVYDMVAPVMSLGVWRCSPLRYVDLQNQALGRANGGVLIAAPIGTGVVLNSVLAEYHDITIIGIDQSWKMLRQARERFEDTSHDLQLVRADYGSLPLGDDVADVVQSLNGLHTFTDRNAILSEFVRCLRPEGLLTGSALVRGQEMMADTVLDRYERYGVYPLLRTAEFLRREIAEQPLEELNFETHGAVMFYSADAAAGEKRVATA